MNSKHKIKEKRKLRCCSEFFLEFLDVVILLIVSTQISIGLWLFVQNVMSPRLTSLRGAWYGTT